MRPHNFNAGPSVLPLPVLEEVQRSLLDTNGSGHCIMEWSHRSPEYDAVRFDAEQRLRRLLGLPSGDPWKVLFLQGGASLQFAMIPMNLATRDRQGHYLVTGVWAKKALEEAERLGAGRAAYHGKTSGFTRIPEAHEWRADASAAYLHVTTNNTIYGTQWPALPDSASIPLVADMSSDILSRSLPHDRCALLYAGAQKNLGPAGLTVVVLRQDLLARKVEGLPAILDYRAHVEADGILNTHPTFAVYLMGRVLKWMEDEGGLSVIAKRNQEKAAMLYAEIDRTGFYRGTADPASRSIMNVCFRLASEDLEKRFLEHAEALRLVGLKGHRSAGGIRASLYNALPSASVEALVAFMRDFERGCG